jgi:NTE family protein
MYRVHDGSMNGSTNSSGTDHPQAGSAATGGPFAAPRIAPRIGVVFGGGALKGMAHVGALKALREAGITPRLYAGSSIGAMIAAAAASGRSVDELTDRALRFRRRDLFRINHVGMLMDRMLSRSIYLESPLRALCDELVAEGTFEQLDTPLLVTAVDIERGVPLVYGRPGFRDARVRDAVYASCALPGFFPPGVVGDRVCIDGGTTDNLPVSIAAMGMDALIAVDVGIADVPLATGIAEQGFASIFMRAATMMMHEQQQSTLERWTSPPLLLVRPKVSHIGWFSFSHVEELLTMGYDSMKEALTHLPTLLAAPGGIFPRREVEIVVDRAACTGCALCVARSPALLALDAQRKAYPLVRVHEFSPADGSVAHGCPVGAITVRPAGRRDVVEESLQYSA